LEGFETYFGREASARMERIWMISNSPPVGDGGQVRRIQAIMEERGMTLVRPHHLFPDEPMPSIEDLVEAKVDTLVLFAGDGTVNTAACKYDKWKARR
jgi:hypothetical protein